LLERFGISYNLENYLTLDRNSFIAHTVQFDGGSKLVAPSRNVVLYEAANHILEFNLCVLMVSILIIFHLYGLTGQYQNQYIKF